MRSPDAYNPLAAMVIASTIILSAKSAGNFIGPFDTRSITPLKISAMAPTMTFTHSQSKKVAHHFDLSSG
jgi:hypothetical protein